MTGAWNTAPTLTRFPFERTVSIGPLLPTDWRPTNTGRSWQRSGPAILALTTHAGDSKIGRLLIGDDGQHDLKIYQDFPEGRPKRVVAVVDPR
ncbi:MAG: DUF2183 domain-containing protein [Actinomycetales bacterium]|uniref:DUF2183 domain-containing protein n=1 Tax=Candidatus Phosphoribacter hodrii TaxID=2953743 RepID=A0A934X718_9MICO|nr:DUF2183 domain-containing protein [Candidatus Phosphoribacter hodrii]